MLLDQVKALARQKGFRVLMISGGATCQLIDEHFGIPVLNPRTEGLEFSLDEAAAFLRVAHDRRVGSRGGGMPGDSTS
jgi:hypothetical protein